MKNLIKEEFQVNDRAYQLCIPVMFSCLVLNSLSALQSFVEVY